MRLGEQFQTRAIRTNNGRSTFKVTFKGTLPKYLGDDGLWHNTIGLVKEADALMADDNVRNGIDPTDIPRLIGTSHNVSFEQIVDTSKDSDIDAVAMVTKHWVDITGGFLDYGKQSVGSFVRDIVDYPAIMRVVKVKHGVATFPTRFIITPPRGRQTDPDIVTDSRNVDDNGKTITTRHRRVKIVRCADRFGPNVRQSFDEHGAIVQYGDRKVVRKVIRKHEDIHGCWLQTSANVDYLIDRRGVKVNDVYKTMSGGVIIRDSAIGCNRIDSAIVRADDKHYRTIWHTIPTGTLWVGLMVKRRTIALKRSTKQVEAKAQTAAKAAQQAAIDATMFGVDDLDYIADGFNKAIPKHPAILAMDDGATLTIYGASTGRIRKIIYTMPDGQIVKHVAANPRAIARWIGRIKA